MEHEFRPILNGPGISGIFSDGHGELAILLLSGDCLHQFGTFDGEKTGNNFVLARPPHEDDWVRKIPSEWRRIL